MVGQGSWGCPGPSEHEAGLVDHRNAQASRPSDGVRAEPVERAARLFSDGYQRAIPSEHQAGLVDHVLLRRAARATGCRATGQDASPCPHFLPNPNFLPAFRDRNNRYQPQADRERVAEFVHSGRTFLRTRAEP